MNELYFYSRRIGYSVGLDSVYPRLVELAQLYVEHKKFDITVWNKAVNSWGVKTKVEFSKQSAKKSISSADHISNFMFYLDILNKSNNLIYATETLEVTSILLKILDKTNQSIFSKVFLLNKIMEKDGDYYANFLNSNFDVEKSLNKIELLFEIKKEELLKYYKNKVLIDYINSALSFNVNKPKNINDLDEDEAKSLLKEQKVNNLNKAMDFRKRWSNEKGLNLFSNKVLTEDGVQYLDFLKSQKIYDANNDVFIIWPTYLEIFQKRIMQKEIQSLAFNQMELYENYIKRLTRNNSNILNDRDAFEILTFIINEYKNLDAGRAKLRNQIKSNTLKYIFYAYIASKDYQFFDLEDFILKESASATPRFYKIILRGSEYGVKVK